MIDAFFSKGITLFLNGSTGFYFRVWMTLAFKEGSPFDSEMREAFCFDVKGLFLCNMLWLFFLVIIFDIVLKS